MRDRPKYWELICKTCFAGGVVSDKWVVNRVRRDDLWPKHCGTTMALRHFGDGDWKPKEDCNVVSCRFATYGACNCSCRGKFHGVNNEKRQFHAVQVAPLQWYRRAFSKKIILESNR